MAGDETRSTFILQPRERVDESPRKERTVQMPGTMTELDFKRECESMMREYFTHGVVTDVLTSVLDLLDRAETPTPLGHTRLLNPSTTRPAVVKRAVVASLDRGPREREMAARFLQALAVHEVIAPAHLEAGFDLILQDLDSLVIDVPRVPTELSHFISRAVVDGVVSRKFLDDSADAEGVDITSHQVAVTARGALRQPGGESHVRAVWGGPEGTTADAARREMRNLLEEYISSGDVAEASRRLAELGVPFYHHEFVRRALTHAIESFAVNSQRPRTITRLLGYLNATGLVSGTQFAKGFARVATSLTEITLDVPDARERFEELVGVAKDEGLLPAALSAWASLRDCGVRGSKELTGCDGLKPVGDNRSLRGHMLRLDSAPDLIQLAEIVGGSRSPVEVDTESNSTEIPAALHLSPANERGKCANERSTTASVLSPESMYIMDDGSHKNESVGIAPAIGKAIIDRCNGALSSASVPNGNQLNSGWSGFRVMRTKYFNDIAFSGNRVNDINKTGTSPGLPIIAAHTNRLLLGKCAWRALYKPAPQRVSGEDAAPWRKQAFLRRVRLMRRSRSCPGGLFELNNAAHVLSIGSVHRHRPFENDYLLGDPVGTGGFAVVREAIHIVSGETFAVKTLRVKLDSGKECGISTGSRDDADSEDTNSQNKEGSEGWKTHRTASMSMEEVTNELVLMQQLSGHPNIVTIKEFFTEDSPSASTSVSKTARDQPNECIVHVVMEFLRGQELVDFITEVGMCVEHDARQVMCPMLDAIAYMHASGVVHRDLKLENLVLARPYDLSSVTLVDFGLAKALKARERAENVCGTLGAHTSLFFVSYLTNLHILICSQILPNITNAYDMYLHYSLLLLIYSLHSARSTCGGRVWAGC